MVFFISEGRLGNQFFQYAFLQSIAKKNEKIVCFDMNVIDQYIERTDNRFLYINSKVFNNRFLRFLFPRVAFFFSVIGLISFFNQKKNAFGEVDLGIFKKKGFFNVTYVETSFFQSPSFFNENKVDLKLKKNYIQRAEFFLRDIPQDKRVFVHVRRGDYLEQYFDGVKGIDLPKKYFYVAMNEIEKVVADPFYIFLTDDKAFVENEFSDIENKIISKESMGADLAIMTLCSYGITSNSSFSWWGACLMKERIKVIFPKYWYGWKTKRHYPIGNTPSWCDEVEPKL